MANSFVYTLALSLLCLFFLGVGVLALGWPERIQEYVISFYSNAKGLASWNPFLSWMKTPSYVVSLRIVGALAVVSGLLALYALLK
jgi:hypothetical protein